jgi:hypothetical protein
MQFAPLPTPPEGLFAQALRPLGDAMADAYARDYGLKAMQAMDSCRAAARAKDSVAFLRAQRALSAALPLSCWGSPHTTEYIRGPRPTHKKG